MMILVTYDVNTTTADGRLRLRHVSRICCNYGQRVQNSVFECRVTPAQAVSLEKSLEREIDKNTDSVRIYELGANYADRIKHVGAKITINLDDTIIL